MKLKIITVGKKHPAWVDTAFQEYQQRFSKGIEISLRSIPSQDRSNNSNIQKIKELEATAIMKEIEASSFVIALDEKGSQITTKELANNLSSWQQTYKNINLIIGGPDGLAESIINRANHIWSLSKLTFPHFFVKVILIEQLYRAYSILNNHPYHRD